MIALRPYQTAASNAVFESWKENTSTLVVIPTGGGKTILFADIIRRIRPMRSIVIAHRQELIWQARDKIERTTGLNCDIEMGELAVNENFFSKSDVIIATVQTLNAGRNGGRMIRFDPQGFGCLIIDECFPAGTMIGKIPIEKIKAGDSVDSFNHAKGRSELRKVVRTFKNVAHQLIKVKLSNGKEIVCTPNHPVFNGSEYSPAHLLKSGDVVFCINENQETTNRLPDLREGLPRKISITGNDFSKTVFLGLQKGGPTIKETEGFFQVQDLRCEGGLFWKRPAPLFAGSEKKPRILQRGLPKGMGVGRKQYPHVENKSAFCISTNEIEQSNVQARNQSKNDFVNAGKNFYRSRREWKAYDSTNDAFKSVAVADGMAGCNGSGFGKVPVTSPLLQSGLGSPAIKARHRSGRQDSQVETLEIPRPQKNGNLECVRVDSVEILERGSNGQFEKLCPHGETYNFEVEENNNYFANGVLVHNCHHAISDSYKAAIDHFKQNPDLRILGVTATPDRTDEEALGQIFESVAFDYEILDAIHEGWLVPIDQQMVSVSDLDFSGVRTTAGDLNGADLAAIMETEHVLHQIATASIDIIGDRRAIVFTSSVKHAENICEIFNRHRPRMAKWVCGKTDKEERRQMLADFASGKVQVVCNCGVLTEGFDDAGVEVVIMGRPTKSRSLYAQMAGRSTRPLPGLVDGLETNDERKAAIENSAKKSCLIVDFVGNSGEHKLISSADILGGKVSPEAIERAANEAKKSGKAVRMSQVLDDAESSIEKEKVEREEKQRMDAARRANIFAKKATYSKTAVSPFDILDIQPARMRGWDYGKTLSEKQRGLLARQGINPDELDYAQGTRLVGAICERFNRRECSFKQAKLLKKYGYDTHVSMADASKLIDALAKNGWKKPETIPA